MRLYQEILGGMDNNELFAGARCTFFPCGNGYFQGVKNIGDFSPERIVVVFKRVDVEILGEGLAVGKYCEGDLKVLGKIREVRVMENSIRV